MLACIEEEHEALLQFLYMAPIGIVQARTNGDIVMVNPLCAQLLMPLARHGNLDNLFQALEGVAPQLRHLAQGFDGEHGSICDALHLQLRSGAPAEPTQKQPQILSLSLLKLDAERLMAVLSDVTQPVLRERELRRSQAWIDTIVTGLTDYALVPLDEHGCITAWNAGIQRLTGFDSQATVGRPYSVFSAFDGEAPQRTLDRLHDADASGWSLDEGWRTRADGSRYWGSCLIAPLLAAHGQADEERAYSLIIRDVSERREATEALRRSVSCDHLTGLANRRALFEAGELEVRRWLRQPRPLALLLIDADHFKRINDQHGHAAGDAVLRHLAAGLAASFREVDVVARLGGEEFVVLLPGTTPDQAETAAARLCASIAAQTVVVDGKAIRYTVSAGVAGMEAGIADVDTLIQRADSAMYAAKDQGRNRVQRWHPGMRLGVAVATVPVACPD